MLAKYWKKIGMLILIFACVFNVMSKLVHKLSLNKEMLYSAIYMSLNKEMLYSAIYMQEQEETTQEEQKNTTN